MEQRTRRDVRLSWIVVCHQSVRDLGVFLPSLRRALASATVRGFPCELVIVDNASTDGSLELARRLAPEARTFRLDRNEGYGTAINRALEWVSGDWLALGNADLFVPRGGLARMREQLEGAAPDVAVVGPALHAPDGIVSLSAGFFPNLWTMLTGLARDCHERKYLKAARHVTGSVDWVTGACLFARRAALEGVGGFDEDFFLYYEDVDLARRLRARGLRVAYEPSMSVVHVRPHHGRPPRPEIEACVRTSRRLYFQKHRPRWEVGLLAAMAACEPLLRPRARRPAGEEPGGVLRPALGRAAARLAPPGPAPAVAASTPRQPALDEILTVARQAGDES